jgi:transposase-like protein
VTVFGLLKRGRKVFAVIVPKARTETLLPIFKEKLASDSIVYTDSFNAYNALGMSDFHHMRINHSEHFADRGNHINGIENFWNQAKRHLRKFNSIHKDNFHCFLKKCEWHFNGSNHQSLYKFLIAHRCWYFLKVLIMRYTYKTCVIHPKGLRVSGDDQTDKLAESFEKESNELGKRGWRLTTVTPTLINGGSVSKLLLTFRKKSQDIDTGKD